MFGEGVFTEGGVLNVNPPVELNISHNVMTKQTITDFYNLELLGTCAAATRLSAKYIFVMFE